MDKKCEKLRKKRSSLVGAFVSTHGKSIDDVDRSIVEARTLLNEVTQELQERVVRWKQLELLCGFNIINNNGLAYLENMLNRGGSNPRKGRMSSSQDDLDDDSSSIYTSAGKNSLDEDSQDSQLAAMVFIVVFCVMQRDNLNAKHVFVHHEAKLGLVRSVSQHIHFNSIQFNSDIGEWETILDTSDRDSNLDFTVIGSPIYCESDTLDHAATEEV
uniref:STIM1/2 Orai1-activating region domain-containing protein n=1 Tax=Timema douglasi TaxID=61478 RepID=A0A7R8ZCU5_TIMDO|nr:unnamed protein product [Timema douglasi]